MNLQKLTCQINENLKEKPLKDLSYILEKYNEDDWKKYIQFCNKSYTRNLIYKDENIKIMLICWNVNQVSKIHNHPEKGCLMKLLEGNISEVTYDRINNDFVQRESKNLKACDVSYIEGKNGFHRIINNSSKSISLHIYSPPDYVPDFFDLKR